LAHTVQDLVLIATIAFVVATVLTPLVSRFAVARGWLDRPDNYRKAHGAPVPTVGGVAVFAAFVVAVAQLPLLRPSNGVASGEFLSHVVALVVAGLAMVMLGVVDDLRGVKPRTKLAVQVAAAVGLYAFHFRIERLSNPFGSPIQLDYWALPVTVLWLVGMSNAFNLIDGMDGLAAGLAFVATVGLLAAAVFNGRIDAALVVAALAGALLGFLPYNFNPARVFLGDCGALPVGLILAALAVESSIKASAAIAVGVPLLALALPILDVALAVVRRFVRRQPLFEGDRRHIHHRLLDMGLTPRRAVVTLYAVAALFTALALTTTMGPKNIVWAVLVVVVLVVWMGIRALGYWEVTEIQKSFLNRLTAGLRPSADAAIRGVELDLADYDNLGEAWLRLCRMAWGIDLKEIHYVPMEGMEKMLPELHSYAPLEMAPEGLGPVRDAMWSFEITIDGEVVAEMVSHRRLGRLDFDPMGLVRLMEGLTARHLARLRREEKAAAEASVPSQGSAPEARVWEPGLRSAGIPASDPRGAITEDEAQALELHARSLRDGWR
jgi:UDP-GlcNAc:undecaprenyl-phosphate GlcNAc-1-phosphate transferase